MPGDRHRCSSFILKGGSALSHLGPNSALGLPGTSVSSGAQLDTKAVNPQGRRGLKGGLPSASHWQSVTPQGLPQRTHSGSKGLLDEVVRSCQPACGFSEALIRAWCSELLWPVPGGVGPHFLKAEQHNATPRDIPAYPMRKSQIGTIWSKCRGGGRAEGWLVSRSSFSNGGKAIISWKVPSKGQTMILGKWKARWM